MAKEPIIIKEVVTDKEVIEQVKPKIWKKEGYGIVISKS